MNNFNPTHITNTGKTVELVTTQGCIATVMFMGVFGLTFDDIHINNLKEI